MTNKLEISRELAENIAAYMEGSASPTVEMWHRELRALLAAPVVERQEPAAMSIPSEDELIANGLGYPIGKEDAVKLHFAGIRSGVITILEAWDAIGHDIGCNPSKDELLDSLRNMAAICEAHGNDMPGEQPAPVAYTTQGMLDIAKQIPLTGRIGAKVTKDERWNVPLYTEQPAPVAVVLPERRSYYPGTDAEWYQAQGWNACLDKVKELNQ